MNRRQFLAGLGAASLTGQTLRNKPNIVFILADDLGYGDLGCYGQKLIQTPNLDRLASEGIRFTSTYAGSTVCAPSRCALMTGKHTGHVRIRGNTKADLLPEDVTVAKLLKSAGYQTGIFGKWGLGTAGHSGIPNRQGFDEWFGYLDQLHAHTFYPTHLWENEREHFLTGNFGIKRHDYTPDLFLERALGFLDRHKDHPFFLYFPSTIPHANNELNRESGNGMEVPEDAPYSDKPWPQPDKNFAAMVTRLDRDVGTLLAKLKTLGIDNNTLVIFTSDNGPHKEGGNHPEFFHSSGPLRGIKRDLYEGGIRVPAIARWPGVITPSQVSGQPWAFWDFLPTVAEIAGVTPPAAIDGISILPALKGKPLAGRPYFYWEFHEKGFTQAVRLGDWKGVRRGAAANPIEIYNLADDLGETKDLASQQPEIVSKIAAIMRTARVDSPDYPIKGNPA
jgi:arylsulfatase A-like enzyme